VETYYPPDIEIAADIGYTIDAILLELTKEKEVEGDKKERRKINNNNLNSTDILYFEIPDTFREIKKQITERIEKSKNDFSYPINPMKLVIDVRNALEDNDIVISDVGAHKLWIAKTYNTYIPNTCLITNGFCSMGFALPGAIAAQLVRPYQKVVVMCGDGGFLMNVQELETAVRLKLPIIVIIWCDSDYGMIFLKQIHEFGRSAFTRFNNPDFVRLAQSFGAIGYHVKSTEEFPKILEKAKESTSLPIIIAIDVDYSKNQILLNDNFN
jgi:acetolactate synthase-1/2/3 large subunit